MRLLEYQRLFSYTLWSGQHIYHRRAGKLHRHRLQIYHGTKTNNQIRMF